MRHLTLVLTSCLIAAPSFAGQVLVVGAAPLQHHDLQDTIILAQPGDIVLVKAGTYESVRSVGRSVTIIADNGATPTLQGALRVIDSPATASIVLSGFLAAAPASAPIPEMLTGLYVRNALGQIVVQDCAFFGRPTLNASSSGAAIVSACAGLSIARSTFNASPNGLANRAAGIYAAGGANIALDQSALYGSPGIPAVQPPSSFDYDGCAGEPGIRCAGAPNSLFVSGGMVVGGTGGRGGWGGGLCTWCGFGGTGGDGVFGNTANALVVLGASLVGGPGGAFDFNCPGGGICGLGGPGAPGVAVYNGHLIYDCVQQVNHSFPFAQPLTLAGASRSVSGSRIVRDTALATLTFQGVAGEVVEFTLGRQPSFTPILAQSGVLHVDGNAWRRVGIVPSSGTLAKSFKLPDLPVSNPGATYFVQARFIDPSTGQTRLSNMHILVEVDASY